MPYKKAWCVGARADELRQLIDDFKFHNVKAAYKPLGDLLAAALPNLPSTTIVVPVPTVASHIRRRGYDHAQLIAKQVAHQHNLPLKMLLERQTDTTQRGNVRKDRFRQAKSAFRCSKVLEPSVPYLLIDDVVTTGATLKYAAKALQVAGATTVWAAAVTYHQIGTASHAPGPTQTYP